jgi:hypothetical protein
MQKKDLAKLALAACILAAQSPQGLQAGNEEHQGNGTLLAAGCGSKCGAKSQIADTSDRSDMYNADRNSYRAYSTSSSFDNDNSNYGSTGSRYGSGTSTQSSPSNNPSYGNANSRSNQSYGSDWNTDANRGSSANWQSNQAYGSASNASSNVSDEDFKRQLDPQHRIVFDSLSQKGKELAKTLASDPSYTDKNNAVREAQRRTEAASSTNKSSGSMSYGR